MAAMARNATSFDAPAVMFVYFPRLMKEAQWSDTGMWLQTVALLLREGAAVDAADASGLTPLYAACHSKRVEVAKLLLEGRADPMLRCHGWSCLDLARREDAPEALRDLVLQHVAAADARRGGATALERLRAVTLQAKAAYGAILKARPAAELDTELGQMTTGELLTQAMVESDEAAASSTNGTSPTIQAMGQASAWTVAPEHVRVYNDALGAQSATATLQVDVLGDAQAQLFCLQWGEQWERKVIGMHVQDPLAIQGWTRRGHSLFQNLD